MAENLIRVYFSFDYERDLDRVKKLRQISGVVPGAAGGFQNTKVWEEARLRGDAAVHGLINDALYNTTVTVVCIGYMTAYRKYLTYEIERSLDRGNGLVGIFIHHVSDKLGDTDEEGSVPPLLTIAGYKIHKYTNKRELVAYIKEAQDIATKQAQREHQREILIIERKSD